MARSSRTEISFAPSFAHRSDSSCKRAFAKLPAHRRTPEVTQALNAAIAALGGTTQAVQHAAVDDTAGLEAAPAPKPKAEKPAKAAAPAPSAPTAEAAPVAAPAPKAEPSAPVVDYAQLSTAVLKLMKLDPAAAGPIAKGLGFETFKLMKEAENAAEVFAKAKALVDAKIAELEAV